MSYARPSDDSDVYIYMHVDGWLECCLCALESGQNYPYDKPIHYITRKTAEMVAHVQTHRASGDKVQDGLEDRLMADAEENDSMMQGRQSEDGR